ncbi:hypothetical protein AN964_12335 [Heyndrickxia shackletonii]|uniref:Uncharacterized protein n=1 Tax=Heyndrickxia shackletonii TaxID=157838 RepID=A0A0Q3WYF1_9BACI|nr:hypothetical protein [Heyndrickxia shackletonii]KQL54202.1 hypothetical protein AN964_12335 [Heyndrickxia shackletonii]NEZ02226.1 hypothetical protein [Heyndrickxia shackletonii]
MTKLKASPSMLRFDKNSPATQQTTISYSYSFEVTIWERLQGQPWGMRETSTTNQRKSPNLKAGDIYEVLAIPGSGQVDPNKPSDFKPEELGDLVRVFCVQIDSQVAFPFDPEFGFSQEIGGTWYRQTVNSGYNLTMAIAVSRTAPLPSFDPKKEPEIEKAFPNNAIEAYAIAPNSLFHDTELSPLFAGNTYHCLIRFTDTRGSWQVFQFTFETKKRTIEINIEDVYIDNCGDDSGTGELMDFRVNILKGNTPFTGLLPFLDENHTIDIHTGQYFSNFHITAQNPFILGPETIDESNKDVNIIVYGREQDGIGERDEPAGNTLGNHTRLFIPTGMHSEEVTNAGQDFKALPTKDYSTLEFTVRVKYSVTYD